MSIQPAVCTRELCVFSFYTLGVMSGAAEEVATGAEVWERRSSGGIRTKTGRGTQQFYSLEFNLQKNALMCKDVH
jgi:hypothetical protein